MKIKVLYICDSLCLGGAEKVLVDILGGLDYTNFEVQVLLLKNENSFAHITEQYPIAVRTLNMPRTNIRRLKDIKYVFEISRIIRSYKPHIIHTQGQDSDLYGQLSRMYSKAVIFSTLHLEDIFRYDKSKANILYRIKLFLEDILSLSCSKIVIVSKSMLPYAVNYRNMSEARMFVVNNAVIPFVRKSNKEQLKKQKYGDSGCHVIGYVGRLASQKNLFTALNAFASLRHIDRNAKFILVGDGPLRSTLESYASDLLIQNDVYFAGAQQDVQSFYETFDVFLLPSFTEGLPLSLLEAMSLRIPIIASAVGGIAEIIEHQRSGILVKPPDISLFTDAIVSESEKPFVDEEQSKEISGALFLLLMNKDRASKLAENAYDIFQERCSLSANIRRLEALYTFYSLRGRSSQHIYNE